MSRRIEKECGQGVESTRRQEKEDEKE